MRAYTLNVKFLVEFDLSRSVEAGGRKLGTLSLPEPTTLDLELCWKHRNEITPVIHLLASLPELAPDEVRALKAADFAHVRADRRFLVDPADCGRRSRWRRGRSDGAWRNSSGWRWASCWSTPG
ncbi:MAG: hypothetical protein OXN96_17355 [Bryobacterales bacterium]|nr:hypothetical protein [Bryobacterales bacterium]MDE0623839.1 hypothetical protein [Bryobacterales bacterium]